jgi:hypothetical protein
MLTRRETPLTAKDTQQIARGSFFEPGTFPVHEEVGRSQGRRCDVNTSHSECKGVRGLDRM